MWSTASPSTCLKNASAVLFAALPPLGLRPSGGQGVRIGASTAHKSAACEPDQKHCRALAARQQKHRLGVLESRHIKPARARSPERIAANIKDRRVGKLARQAMRRQQVAVFRRVFPWGGSGEFHGAQAA